MFFIVAGPESSGTRIFTKVLSAHPEITGSDGGHQDRFSELWENGKLEEFDTPHAVTRRSFPAGRKGGVAKFGVFDTIPIDTIRKNGHEPFILIPVRSYPAHISSWTKSRCSVSGNGKLSVIQYKMAYWNILQQCGDTEWIFLTLEELSDKYMSSIYSMLGISDFKAGIEYNGSNEKHYDAN